jgi:hypothetical protein
VTFLDNAYKNFDFANTGGNIYGNGTSIVTKLTARNKHGSAGKERRDVKKMWGN